MLIDCAAAATAVQLISCTTGTRIWCVICLFYVSAREAVSETARPFAPIWFPASLSFNRQSYSRRSASLFSMCLYFIRRRCVCDGVSIFAVIDDLVL